MVRYHAFPVLNDQFIVDTKYEFIREMGQGAYGVVCSAKDTKTGLQVAIKRVSHIFDKTILAKRALREIKLLTFFNGHENITSILDMNIVDLKKFNEVYLVQELMEADLHQIIRSTQPLTDSHFQCFIYQICRGLKYIHSANVLHRDLKPGNLLVNANCELKICDFGLARGYTNNADNSIGFMTEYVATRWYRAPEIMLSFDTSYTKAIDLWSVGCIFAEMLGRKPLFKGRDYVDQLNQILVILGTPDEETIARIGSEKAQMYVRKLPFMSKIPFEKLYPEATPLAIDLLKGLLELDPCKRITAEEALRHPYLSAYHDEHDEPVHPCTINFSFESLKSTDDIKKMIEKEVVLFGLKSSQCGNGMTPLRRHKSMPNQYEEALISAESRILGRASTGNSLKADDQVTSAATSLNQQIDIEELEKELSRINL